MPKPETAAPVDAAETPATVETETVIQFINSFKQADEARFSFANQWHGVFPIFRTRADWSALWQAFINAPV